MKKSIALIFALVAFASAADELGNKWIKQIYKASAPAPTVIVGHGCDGFSAHYSSWGQQINSWGYNVVVMDSFGPRGYISVCNRGAQVAPFTRLSDVSEIVKSINASDFHKGKIGFIGFSHGGSLALHVATADKSLGIAASVAYYPNCKGNGLLAKDENGADRIASFAKPQIPAVMMLGGKDEWTPMSFCLNFVSNGNYVVNTYENASHAFDLNMPYRTFAGHTLWYDATADKDSREKTKVFFDAQLMNSAQ